MEFLKKMETQDAGLVSAVLRIAKEAQSLTVSQGYRESEPRALLVGGFVRDTLLGVPSKDADIEIFGADSDLLEHMVNGLYPGRVNAVGRSFCVLKIALPSGIEIDVSLPRRESKAGRGHKGFRVDGDPTMSVQDAARRRDFTINAISVDPLTGEIIDPFFGRTDLERRTLRCVDPETFIEDPLRVYRAVQLAARFALTAEDGTKAFLTDMVRRGDLESLSKERVTDELKKLFLRAERPSVGFEFGRDIGLVEKYFPQLYALSATEQEPEWHPEGDVWIHTLMVLDQAAAIIRQPERRFSDEEKRQVMLGALCHDLGKPLTTRVIDGRIRSRGHSDAGVGPTDEFLGALSFSEDDRAAVRTLVKEHLIPGLLANANDRGELEDDAYANAVRKLIRRTHPVHIEVLLAVAEADFRGRSFPTSDQPVYLYGKKMREAIARGALDVKARETLVRGEDCIKLGVPEGARIGELVREVEAARDRGDIATREDGLAYLSEILSR